MKLEIKLLKPSKLVEYLDEIEYQEIICYSDFFFLNNNKNRQKIIHHRYLTLLQENNIKELLCHIYRKKTPVIANENFHQLIKITTQNNVPIYTDYEDYIGPTNDAAITVLYETFRKYASKVLSMEIPGNYEIEQFKDTEVLQNFKAEGILKYDPYSLKPIKWKYHAS